MARILLIDDSEDMGILVANGLSPYLLRQALSIAEAEQVLKEDTFDLILIDVGLPDGNGFDLCIRLNQDLRFKFLPKILLTALDQASEKVYGFNCGADDYVTKPFNPVELRARVERSLRSQLNVSGGTVVHGCFSFQLEFQKCFAIDCDKKVDLNLTPTEFRLLLALAQSEGKVLSRQTLEQVGWEAHGAVIQIRGVDTHVAHLRKKLGPLRSAIVSVYGQGYSLDVAKLKNKTA